MHWIWLCGGAFLAGLVDSVVGGGGLIQTPTLLLWLPPSLSSSIATVFGTNKLASLCGTSVATLQYARQVRIPWRTAGPMAGTAFIASFVGARAVAYFRSEVLRPLVFFLLVAVAIYTYWKKDLGSLHRPKLERTAEKAAALITGCCLGFYDGFFGPGTGSFLIFIFVGVFGFDFLAASGSAKAVNLATNLAAVTYFAGSDHIAYQYAIPMAAFNMLGSATGSRLAILRGSRFVRRLFLAVVGAILLRLGWDLLKR